VAISAGGPHTVGLKANGTVVATKYIGNPEDYHGQCDVASWKGIVAISAGSWHTVGLKADGTVVAPKYIGDLEDYLGQCDVADWKLFRQLDNIEQERIDTRAALQKQIEEVRLMRLKQEEEKRRQMEESESIARKKQQKAALIAHERHKAGLCQHCGGNFKGIFKKNCTVCGKLKDY
jgi:hypothetical protein